MILRTITILIFAVLLSACATKTQVLQQVDPGISSAQVEHIMGKHDGFSSIEIEGHIYTSYQYDNRNCTLDQSMTDKCDFVIIFKDDLVVSKQVIKSSDQ